MTTTAVSRQRTTQILAVVLGIVWVAASFGQQVSWLYQKSYAICGPVQTHENAGWLVLATLAVVAVAAVVHLKIGVQAGHPERAGLVSCGVGLGFSLAAGLFPFGFSLFLLVASLSSDEPVVGAGYIVNLLIMPMMFVVTPAAGIASLFIADSETTLKRMGSANRARLAFAIGAGVPALWVAVTYLVVGLNCGTAAGFVR